MTRTREVPPIMRLVADLAVGDEVRVGLEKDPTGQTKGLVGKWGRVTGFTDQGDAEIQPADGSIKTIDRLVTVQTNPFRA